MSSRALSLSFLAVLATAWPGSASGATLLRSTSATRGELRGGHFILDDPRSAFQGGVDHQVVVFFEWDAPPGRHQCSATWRDPSGSPVLVQPTQQDSSTRRFGVYWTLTLPERPVLGLWAVEATVDGEPAGVHTFRLVEGTEGTEPASRRALAPAALYERLTRATVAVEALRKDGQRLWAASGFYLDDRNLVTAYQVIEGADALRLVLPDGRRVDPAGIVLVERRQDWAVIRTEASGVPSVPLATRAATVGDRCLFLDVDDQGVPALREVGIVGRRILGRAGPRLSLSTFWSTRAVGSPIVNDYGEAVALLGGTLTPGTGLASPPRLRFAPRGPALSSSLGLPVEVLPRDLSAPPFPLADLRARGLVVPPLSSVTPILVGVLGRRSGNAVESATEFSGSDGFATVEMTWDSPDKREGDATFQLCDLDNRTVLTSKPVRLRLDARTPRITTWNLPLGKLAPATYRLDLLYAQEPIWRTFLTVTE